MQGSGMSSLYIKSTWSQARGTRPSRLHKVRQTSSLPRSLYRALWELQGLFPRSEVGQRLYSVQQASSLRIRAERGRARRGRAPGLNGSCPWAAPPLTLLNNIISKSERARSLLPNFTHPPSLIGDSILRRVYGFEAQK